MRRPIWCSSSWRLDPAAADRADARALAAISAGAVFFGGLTYIGNAPNMMLRAIAAHRGVRMPGFFGFMLLASGVVAAGAGAGGPAVLRIARDVTNGTPSMFATWDEIESWCPARRRCWARNNSVEALTRR